MAHDRRNLTEGFLFTDQYQLTMAQVYWKQGLHERPALFDYFFREYPDYGLHQAGYAVARPGTTRSGLVIHPSASRLGGLHK